MEEPPPEEVHGATGSASTQAQMNAKRDQPSALGKLKLAPAAGFKANPMYKNCGHASLDVMAAE
jgi:hypothetical protein